HCDPRGHPRHAARQPGEARGRGPHRTISRATWSEDTMKKTKILCLAAALAFAPSAFAVYKCVDEKGITRIGETPPDECANVPMQEVGRNGSVIRTIPPSLTPEQVK